MKRFPFYLILALIATTTAYAEDTIVFKNGDVLTGQVISRDDNSIRFSSDSLGELNLDTSTVSEIISPPTESTDAAAQSATTSPTDESAPSIVQAESIEAAEEKSQWSGQAGLAIAMREKTDLIASGVAIEDSFETYRVYGNVDWAGERNSLRWNWTYRYAEDETRKRDDFLNLTQRYNRNFHNGFYTEAKTVYQKDYNRNIDNEFLQTAEIGRKWFQQSRIRVSTSAGGGYHAYERTGPGEGARIDEPKFIFDESLEWDMVNTLTLFQKYTHLGNLDEYHFLFSFGLENKLIKELFLRLEYRIDRDTDIAYDGNGFTDKAFLTSLLYKF
jgi:opacity protein-like surface antigen